MSIFPYTRETSHGFKFTVRGTRTRVGATDYYCEKPADTDWPDLDEVLSALDGFSAAPFGGRRELSGPNTATFTVHTD